ncbi:hypothetical protein KDA_10110 [Dictyobacter alpinus]|uniref:Branched-chain amino acid ABC transporter n=1 Tax=Dictyobacter alpinus TaxID=2014873 RepID=A0A402B2J3_9CHLR|nr:AzlD domain-containing protein [Dictyobacter alpinus]GCE25527.1 hypothetical protein KDA_10110 [Dictyobacter alpinus]
MQTNLTSVLTILGMALITYATRAGGVWLMSSLPLSKKLQAWVNILPGTLLVSIVAPTVFTAGFAEVGASLATIFIAIRTRNILLSMLIGVGVVVGLRWVQAYF